MQSKNYFIFITFILSALFLSCEDKEWKNPFDANSDPKSWAPKNLQIEQLSVTIVKLTWEQEEDNISGFKIDRKIENNNWNTEYAIIKSDMREFIDEQISVCKNYKYRLYAYVYENKSSSEEEHIFITPEHYIVVPYDFSTIQFAINNATDGDTILICPGTYYESIDFHSYHAKNLVVISFYIPTGESSYISNTIISGNNKNRVIRFDNDATIKGITISDGSVSGQFGGGIYCSNQSNLSMENVKIKDCYSYIGGGIYCVSCSLRLINVLISNNSSDYGGGIYSNNSNIKMVNVTIGGNVADIIGGGIEFSYNSSISMVNCISWNKSDNEIHSSGPGNPGKLNASFSDIQFGWGTGNIKVNPIFLGNSNYHLQSNSPCIDAGNPDPQYNDPDGSRNDMGAYGGPNGDW